MGEPTTKAAMSRDKRIRELEQSTKAKQQRINMLELELAVQEQFKRKLREARLEHLMMLSEEPDNG